MRRKQITALRKPRAHHTPAAWADFVDAKKRLDASRKRLVQLADKMDAVRAEQSEAVADAADALQRLAVPVDRDAA
jgi:division protein CdvB (Snf7/Vps24/ESCRT-III family)